MHIYGVMYAMYAHVWYGSVLKTYYQVVIVHCIIYAVLGTLDLVLSNAYLLLALVLVCMVFANQHVN